MEVDNKKNDQNIIPNDADKPQKGVNVPNLRFPCFYSTWCKNKFKNLFVLLKNNTLSRAELNYNKGKIKNIHYGDILIKFNNFVLSNANSIPYINDESIPNKYSELLLKNGDLIIADTAEDYSVGKATELIFNDKSLIISGLHTIPCRPVQNIFASKYLGYYINSPSYHNQLLPLIQGIKVSSISKSQIVNTYITYPDIKEQNKIAKFLTLIEQRIDTLSKIIEDLELFKKSIENQYFYCDKSNDYASLGDIITQLNSRNEQNKDFEVLSVSNKYGFIPQSEQFDDHEVASANRSNYKIVKQNDFAYNPARINVGSIAMLRRNKIGIVSPMYICFRANNNKILSSYLDYFTHSNKFNKEVLKNLEGSVRLCLSFESLSKIKIYVPSLSTQYEIVKNLDLISNKIFIENKILEKLKEQKKYLLSNMFI